MILLSIPSEKSASKISLFKTILKLFIIIEFNVEFLH